MPVADFEPPHRSLSHADVRLARESSRRLSGVVRADRPLRLGPVDGGREPV